VKPAPGVLTGVERRVDGLEPARPSNGVGGPEPIADGVSAGEGAPESFVDAGMLKVVVWGGGAGVGVDGWYAPRLACREILEIGTSDAP